MSLIAMHKNVDAFDVSYIILLCIRWLSGARSDNISSVGHVFCGKFIHLCMRQAEKIATVHLNDKKICF